MPDPIVDRADGASPEHEVLLANTIGLALLVVRGGKIAEIDILSDPERLRRMDLTMLGE